MSGEKQCWTCIYLAVDRAGVGLVIAEPRDTFNQIYFDIVDGKYIEAEGEE